MLCPDKKRKKEEKKKLQLRKQTTITTHYRLDQEILALSSMWYARGVMLCKVVEADAMKALVETQAEHTELAEFKCSIEQNWYVTNSAAEAN